MSTTLKIGLGIVAVVLVLCVGLAAAGTWAFANLTRASQAGPVESASTAGRIASFELAAGYQPEAAIEIGSYIFVSYAPGNGHSHIMLIQAPKNSPVDQAALEQSMQQARANGKYDRTTRMTVVQSTRTTIRGQQVTAVISEGTNSDGQPYRTLTAAFAGRGGPALLSVESPTSAWNQARVDAFLASMR